MPVSILSSGTSGSALPPRDTDVEFEVLRSKSLPMLVQEKIEQMILGGQLLPGQRINEMALAKLLGVSRSPIREACRKLESAGMVEIINNRGMFVRSVGLQQALEIYEIRGALAFLAGTLLARHTTDDELSRLSKKVDEMDVCASSGDAATYYRLNLEFHGALVAATRNTRLTDMFLGTDKELHLYRHRSLVQASGMSTSNQEHRAIVEAVKSRDETAAGDAFRRHVLNGRDRAVEAAANAP